MLVFCRENKTMQTYLTTKDVHDSSIKFDFFEAFFDEVDFFNNLDNAGLGRGN